MSDSWRAGPSGAVRAIEGREELADEILDAIGAHVAAVDLTGGIIAVNAAWVQFGAERGMSADPQAWLGVNYLDACRDAADGAEHVVDGLSDVLGGRASSFSHEYPCHDAGRRRWYRVQATPLVGDEGVFGAVIAHHDISASKLTELELERAALYDALTGLPQRSRFRRQMAGAADDDAVAGVVILDLDRLKLVNDSLGHQAGDRLLSEAGQRLRDVAGEQNLVARLGGDQFCVVARGNPSRRDVSDLAHAVRAAFDAPFDLGEGHVVSASASIGAAVADSRLGQTSSLLRDAGTAMQHAKRQGRGQVALFEAAMRLDDRDTLALEADLRRAVGRDELRLHYQPMCDMTTGDVLAYEALVRWERPGHGLVMPAAFIPTAEDSEVIHELGAWVLGRACEEAAGWRRATLSDAAVSVNVSSQQLRSPRIVAEVSRALASSGLPPDALILEITESTALEADPGSARLTELRALGVRIAIDDFGAGQTSLAYLRDLPVDILKLDQSFMRRLGSSATDAAITRSLVELSHALGLMTVAEGIEDIAQHALLTSFGCAAGQGFLYARPAPLWALDCIREPFT